MARYLILDLEAPMLAFGGEIVDANGIVVDYPLTSSLTGLIANALGWERRETARLAELQSRIRFAARIERDGDRIVDFQTVQLAKNDKRWTTRGASEGRGGGGASYGSPHIRYAHYHTDRRLVVALELKPGSGPDIDAVAAAIVDPARPLFIGRKTCLPSTYLFGGIVEAGSLTEAITAGVDEDYRMILPEDEPAVAGDRIVEFSDLRDWIADVHTGTRLVRHRRHMPEISL